MKKFFTFIAAMLFAGSMMAQVTITPANFTPVETSDYSTIVEGVTVAVTASTVTADQLRIFKNQSITISAEANIIGIEFTCTANGTAKYGPGCFAAQEGYTFEAEGKTGTWEGQATSVSFTAETNQVRVTQIVVTLEGAEPKEVFYLTGSFRSWAATADADYKFAATATEGEYALKVAFEEAVKVKAIGLKDGEDTKWYPAGMNNNLNLEAGEYTIRLRPAGTEEEGWHEGVLLAEKKEAVADPTNCAEAAEAALSVSANNELFNNGAVYTIEGFVTSIQTAYSEQYHNVTFWMADEKEGGNVLEAFRAACAAEADAPAVGDKVAVTGSLTKYNTTPEFAAGCTFTIIERAQHDTTPAEEIVIADTLSVARAIELGMALDSMGVSEEYYAIEGYVINPGAFSLLYKNQSWYMADEAAAEASDFQAYNCYPLQGNDTLKVLAGDKVQLVGKLKKYYNRNEAKYIIEVEKGNASFIEMAEGDHSVIVTTEEITVAEALEIGNALAAGGVTEKQYKIKGYVSAINVKPSDAYSEQYKNQSFYVADDATSTAASNAEGAFYVYRGKPETEAEIPVGTYVEFTCTIKKYVPSGGGDPVIENADQNILITILGEGPVEDPADVVFSSADFNGQGTSGTGSEVTATKDGVTFLCDKAFGDQYGVRCYRNSVVTISSADQQIGKIVFEFATVSGKTYDGGGMAYEIVVNGMEWSATMADQARMNKISIYFGEYEKEEVDTLSVAEALEIAHGLEVGATQRAVVKAYVAKVKTPYSEQYGNITVYLTDDPTATYGDLQAYRASCSAEDGAALAEHDLVLVEGNLTHTQNAEGDKDYYEFAQGAKLKLLETAPEGIENVVLTEQAQKVVVDGVIYIVRDNKMYNLQGAQVR